MINLFRKLKIEMLELQKDKFENRIFEEFDLISWLESKIENRNYLDIMKEKYFFN